MDDFRITLSLPIKYRPLSSEMHYAVRARFSEPEIDIYFSGGDKIKVYAVDSNRNGVPGLETEVEQICLEVCNEIVSRQK